MKRNPALSGLFQGLLKNWSEQTGTIPSPKSLEGHFGAEKAANLQKLLGGEIPPEGSGAMLRAVGDLGGDDLDARSAALIVAADKLGSEPMIQKTQELNELLMRELRWHESFLKSIDREEAYLAWCRMRGTS